VCAAARAAPGGSSNGAGGAWQSAAGAVVDNVDGCAHRLTGAHCPEVSAPYGAGPAHLISEYNGQDSAARDAADLDALFGKWPGDETDEEFAATLAASK
jgi:hypothetical protein